MSEHLAPSTASAFGQLTKDRSAAIVLLLALASCTMLMLPMFPAVPLALDEYGTYWIAGDGPLSPWKRSLNYENIPPLAPLIHRGFFRIFGESELTFRLPSALCYIGSVWLIWRLGREILDARFGSLLALTLAWHPALLDEVRIARCYGLTLLLSIFVLWAMLKWLHQPEGRWQPWAWTLGSAALIWTHYLNSALVILTSMALAWALFRDSFGGKVRLLIAWLCLAGTSVPLWAPLVRMSVWGQYFGFQTETQLTETISPFWWAGFPAAFLTSRLIRPQARSKPNSKLSRPRASIFFCAIVPMLVVVLCCRGDFASLANPRYRTSIEAAGICLWVFLIARNHSMKHSLIAVGIGLLTCWLASETYPWQLKRLHASQSIQWKELAQHVDAHGKPGQTIFVQSGLGEAALLRDFFADPVLQDYVACRLGRFYLKSEHRRIGLPFVWDLSPGMSKWYSDQLKSIASSDEPSFWLAAATDTDLNESSNLLFEKLVRLHQFVAAETVTLPQAKLILFRYQATPP